MRGTLLYLCIDTGNNGIIPAHAGNTKDISGYMGGGQGSSPRMRGTLAEFRGAVDVVGIIPAHAGNTLRRGGILRRSWDHPRACGEHLLRLIQQVANEGSSPRMRGTRLNRLTSTRGYGIIPAHAGNTG